MFCHSVRMINECYESCIQMKIDNNKLNWLTFGSLPCFSRSDIITLICSSCIIFNASGLSIKTQWRTSNIPKREEKKLTIDHYKIKLNEKEYYLHFNAL